MPTFEAMLQLFGITEPPHFVDLIELWELKSNRNLPAVDPVCQLCSTFDLLAANFGGMIHDND